MALVDNAWYVDSAGYSSVTAYANSTYVCGQLLRQATTPAVGSERVYVCTTGGIATGEPTWTTTRGAIQSFTGAGKCQECTGIAALNGDLTNTPTWTTVKSTAITLGQVITNVAQTLVLICTVAGTDTGGTEPSWAAYTTAGATTAHGATWTTLGAPANYSIWNSPHARIASSIASTWGQAGNTIYVSASHAETQATLITLQGTGTVAKPILICCIKNAPSTTPASSTDVTTGATVTSTYASNVTAALTIYGYAYYYGIAFTASQATGTSNIAICSAGVSALTFDTCQFNNTLTQANAYISIGGGTGQSWVLFNNTTVQFGATSQTIHTLICNFKWKNTVSAVSTSGSIPTTLFSSVTEQGGYVTLEGLDLSAITGTIIGTQIGPTNYLLKDCKLASGVTISATPTLENTYTVDSIRCDSAGTNYQQYRNWYQGQLTTNTGIVRTGGAQVTGTGISWVIATTANVKQLFPFETPYSSIQNTSTSSLTATMYGIVNAATVPNNNQLWLESEYLGSSLTPIGSFINNGISIFGSSSGLTADTSAWDSEVTAWTANHAYTLGQTMTLSNGQVYFCSTAGTSNATTAPTAVADGSLTALDGSAKWRAGCRFSMANTFTPALAGQIDCKIKAAQASTTFYVDPQPVL